MVLMSRSNVVPPRNNNTRKTMTITTTHTPLESFAPFPSFTKHDNQHEQQLLSESEKRTIDYLRENVEWNGRLLTATTTTTTTDVDITHNICRYGEDYGHIIHNQPLVVCIPSSVQDVQTMVQFIIQMRKLPLLLPIQLVIRGGGGNVCGASQSTTGSESSLQMVMDLSLLNRVEPVNQQENTVWVEACSTWDQVLTETDKCGRKPIVLPDYLGITVAGTCSIGGLGGETPLSGPCAHHIQDVQVVDGNGNSLVCNESDNVELFHAVLGGMGQFGIITRLNLKLTLNEPMVRVYHLLTTDYRVVLNSFRPLFQYLENLQMSTLQSFILTNRVDFIRNWVMFGKEVQEFSQQIQTITQQQENRKWIYMIELTCRFNQTVQTCSQLLTNEQLTQQLKSQCIEFPIVYSEDLPTSVWDRRLTVMSIPALVQSGAWHKRHPWLNLFFTQEIAEKELENVIESLDPELDLGGGHIGFTPFKPFNANSSSSISTPYSQQDSFIYLLVLGRDEMTDTDSNLQRQMNGNRRIWDHFSTYKQSTTTTATTTLTSSVYPTCVIPDWNQEDWKRHFGEIHWNLVKENKRRMDPMFVFADNRSFGFSSLYVEEQEQQSEQSEEHCGAKKSNCGTD